MSRTDRKNGERTGDRDERGRFVKGSRNRGRPRGSRNKATVAVEELLSGEAVGLTRKAIDLALSGNV